MIVLFVSDVVVVVFELLCFVCLCYVCFVLFVCGLLRCGVRLSVWRVVLFWCL